MVDYHPEVILAGRRINHGMGKYVAEKAVKTMARAGGQLSKTRVAVLGATFKENCADRRNSQVVGIIAELKSYGTFELMIHDPVTDAHEDSAEYGCAPCARSEVAAADALIIAVTHDRYGAVTSAEILPRVNRPAAIVGVKSLLPAEEFSGSGVSLWGL